MKYRLGFLCLILLIGSASSSLAQKPLPSRVQSRSGNDCALGEAVADLDVNNVRARLFNNGGLFWRGTGNVYKVPKDGNANAVFAAGLWVGGLVGGELRFAGTAYGPWEFWPGPLAADGSPPADCTPFDRIYTIRRADLDRYEQTGEVTDDLRDWPAHLGAPTLDGDGNPDNYDLAAGDRPDLVGDQMAWWVMNDAAGTKEWSETAPIGLEVQVTAYAYALDAPLAHTTFYRYKLIYKGDAPFEDIYLGIWTDPDLGNAADDYVGSDTLRHMGFVYNGTEVDQGIDGYGTDIPALGYVLLETPEAPPNRRDDDYDGVVDEAGEALGMSAFIYYTGDASFRGDPRGDTSDPYNYLRAIWRDGTPMTVGGYGYGGSEVTTYMFPGDPATRAYWSEENLDGHGARSTPSDHRFLMSSGPFTMLPGETEELTFAIVWSQHFDRLASVTKLKRDAEAVRRFYQTGDLSLSPLPAVPPVPLAVSPPPHAVNVAPSTTFLWRPVGDAPRYRVQIAEDSLFFRRLTNLGTTNGASFQLEEPLKNSTTYYWRVRAENVEGDLWTPSPWSPAQPFTTGTSTQPAADFVAFETVANADGPIEPPTGAAADFQGFPVNERPGDTQQRGEGIWMIHAGDDGSRTSFPYEAFLEIVTADGALWPDLFPYDYEIRFTDEGSWTVDPFRTGSVFQVPFELWRTGVGTPGDPSDDVRLIPYVQDLDGSSLLGPNGPPAFNLLTNGPLSPADHSASGGPNDPQTDWIYWHLPDDDATGERGYRAWEADLLVRPPAEAAAIYGEHDREILRRMTFFNWNGGDVDAGIYNQALPERGTVFRIRTTKPVPVAFEARLAALNLTSVVTSAATGEATLTGLPDRLQVAGRFTGLSSDFVGAALHRGTAGTVGAEVAALDVALADDRRSGTFPAERNIFSNDVLRYEDELYLVVRSEAYQEGEIRGQLLLRPNLAPAVPVIEAPTADSLIFTGAAHSLDIAWAPAPDPNGNPVVYRWQLAADRAFNDPVAEVPVGEASSFALELALVDAMLAGRGVPLGGNTVWYHRVIATDGSHAQTGPATPFRLGRGTLDDVPTAFALQGNFPNPFNPTTTLLVDLPERADVQVAVYDVLGRRVLTLDHPTAGPGALRLPLDASGLASGLYLYHVTARAAATTWRETGRMVLIK